MLTNLARALLLVCVAAIVGIAAGCGGDDDSGGGSEPLGLTQEGGGTTDTAGGEGGAIPGLASSGECRQLAELGAKLGEAISGTNQSDIESQVGFFQEFADQAPEEIRSDFQVLADAYSKIAEAVADANLQSGEQPDPEALQKLQDATSSLDEERLAEASANVEKWVRENCQE